VCCGTAYNPKSKEKREVGVIDSMGEEKNQQRNQGNSSPQQRERHEMEMGGKSSNARLFSGIWPDGMGHGKIPAAPPRHDGRVHRPFNSLLAELVQACTSPKSPQAHKLCPPKKCVFGIHPLDF
jgi:hypothetical protein